MSLNNTMNDGSCLAPNFVTRVNFAPVGHCFNSREDATNFSKVMDAVRGNSMERIVRKTLKNNSTTQAVGYYCSGESCTGNIKLEKSKVDSWSGWKVSAQSDCICELQQPKSTIPVPYDDIGEARCDLIRLFIMQLKIPLIGFQTMEPAGWTGKIFPDIDSNKKRKRGQNFTFFYAKATNGGWIGLCLKRNSQTKQKWVLDGFPEDIQSWFFPCTKTQSPGSQLSPDPTETLQRFCLLCRASKPMVRLLCKCPEDDGYCLDCFTKSVNGRKDPAVAEGDFDMRPLVKYNNHFKKQCHYCFADSLTSYKQIGETEVLAIKFPKLWIWERPFHCREDATPYIPIFSKVLENYMTVRDEVNSLLEAVFLLKTDYDAWKGTDNESSFDYELFEKKQKELKDKQDDLVKLESEIPKWATDSTATVPLPDPAEFLSSPTTQVSSPTGPRARHGTPTNMASPTGRRGRRGTPTNMARRQLRQPVANEMISIDDSDDNADI